MFLSFYLLPACQLVYIHLHQTPAHFTLHTSSRISDEDSKKATSSPYFPPHAVAMGMGALYAFTTVPRLFSSFYHSLGVPSRAPYGYGVQTPKGGRGRDKANGKVGKSLCIQTRMELISRKAELR